MADEEQLEILKRGVKEWNQWRKQNPDVRIDLSSADLEGFDFFCANLNGSDLSNANLRLANLVLANLNEANLNGACLSGVQALYTNFERATLTGACIKNWNIDSNLQLDSVICEYIYLKREYKNGKRIYTDRRPSDPSKIFAPGDFARLVQKAQETVDLIFRNGIDWQAFSNAFQALKADRIKVEGSDRTFCVRAIENLDDGSFVVRINTPKDVDKGEIERSFQTQYEEELQRLEVVYREKLQFKDEQIEFYKQHSADMMEIVKLQASRDIRQVNINSDTIQGAGYTQGDTEINPPS